ncbi:DsbA family protein [Tepidamorphus sp. 3E244]|uniref:DsbA family protein n=1 Tax=Tepidamorphus sp. 3E244 TaxID=3385498 RepID=UPI0038FC2C40
MDRRTLIIGGAVVIAAAAAGGYYFTTQAQSPATGGGTASDQLAVAGPLGDRALGEESAPVTIYEYASFTCGHCRDFHDNTYPTIKEEYIDTGKVRFVFREFPLDPVATLASMIARCTDENRYYPFVDALFELQRSWIADDPVAGLQRVAKQAGFSQERFDACRENQSLLDGVNWVKERASTEFGVDSTPTFFINGEKVSGNLPIDEFRSKIDAALNAS